MRTWKKPSSSSDDIYTITLHDTGIFTCECRGWKTKRKIKGRLCTHIKDVAAENNMDIEVRGEEHVYLVSENPILLPDPPKVKSKNPEVLDAHALGYVSPMLASAMREDKTIDDYPTWPGEVKYDGYRVIAVVDVGGSVRFWSRPKEGKVGIDKTSYYHANAPHVVAALSTFPVATYDGEFIAGVYGKSYNVADLSKSKDLRLAIFDIPRLDGRDCSQCPLSERRETLEAIFNRNTSDAVILAQQLKAPVTLDNVKKIWAEGGEGVILKRPDSPYQAHKRSPDWIKIKKAEPAVLRITGFAAGENGPFSRVLLAHDKKGIETRCKTKNAWWLNEFEKNWQAYIGKYLVIRHYGETATKFRGPIIWDHMAGEGEIAE